VVSSHGQSTERGAREHVTLDQKEVLAPLCVMDSRTFSGTGLVYIIL